MEEIKTAEGGSLIKIPIEDEVKQAYIDYSMSVIVQRALPDVRDGLKPVHRRIMYAMDTLHLASGGKTKKCATIVGEVLGHYHPHGDASVYDALVRLGQDFAQRYTTVTPQGNFGTIAGDPPAAYRYTEAKMSKITEEMTSDINKNTVDMIRNFDDTCDEPAVLPSKFPFLLCNGTTGIAVGMATNMPTHNLREVADAICAYIDNKEISIEELMHYIKGPDFPTGGIIYGTAGIKKAYTTGRGKIVIRSKFTIETDKRGKESIVFTEVPYGVNTTNIIRRIKELVRDKQIDGVVNANDESSDRSGMRLVVDLKKGAITKIVLNQLFAKTDLQSNFGVINLALVPQIKEGAPRYDEPGMLTLPPTYLKPEVLTLKQLIQHFVDHRDEVITRRTIYDLKVAKHRMHILEALITAINNIDEVIQIIKSSENTEDAKLKLEKRFNFDDEQAQAIVDMQLKRLTHLLIEDLQKEIKELQALIDYLESLLADHNKILNLIKDETRGLAEKYGDDRRTEIVASEVEQINVEDMIKDEDMVVMISRMGYIKRVPADKYKKQSRGGTGSNGTNLLDDDYVNQLFIGSTKEILLFITNLGRAYWMKIHEIPESEKAARGAHIKGLLQVGPDEEITTVVSLKEFSDDLFLFMTTAQGVVKKVRSTEFQNAKTRGIIGIKLNDNDKLISAIPTTGDCEVMLISRRGKALRITEDSVRLMGRASCGIKGMKLSEGDEIAAAVKVEKDANMILLTEKGVGKRISFDLYSVHGRGTGGQRIFGNTESKGEIIGAINVKDKDEVVCMTSQGKTLRFRATDIKEQGTGASGVNVVRVTEPDFIVGLDKVQADEDDSTK
ncbi:MAG: DNA topoisomerase (ATP-hydrolyzing) subunit A [Spirochaetales bacterium]|nr:DNA topoisomerase (ATP-hydrolyzing) subunit A [Spirochaetales bacterium]